MAPSDNTEANRIQARDERQARIMVREIAPVWHDRYARLILRALPDRPKLFALDVHCAHGHTTQSLLQRLPESTRVLALQNDPSLDPIARARIAPEWKERVYFRPGNFDDVTAMAADSYDLTIANVVLGEDVHDWQSGLRELVRVTKPGGEVLATLPLRRTWAEVDDIFAELLAESGMVRELAMHDKLRSVRPRPDDVVNSLSSLGLVSDDFVFEHETFELLFRSGREFLFSAVVERGPLRVWKALLGKTTKPQELFWRFKEAIDTYYQGRTLAVTVHAGIVHMRVPGRSAMPMPSFAARHWRKFPALDTLFSRAAASQTGPYAAVRAEADEDDDLELDIDISYDHEVGTSASGRGRTASYPPVRAHASPRRTFTASEPESDAEGRSSEPDAPRARSGRTRSNPHLTSSRSDTKGPKGSDS